MAAAIALALAAASGAQAEGQLKTITVTATRTDTAAEDVPATVTTIDKRDIERRLPADEADLLKNEPDISMARDLRRFGSTRVNIRGIEDNRVTQMVDGVGLPDFYNSGGPTNFTMNAPLGTSIDFLKRVEILRGPASSLYGSDTIGGVVGYLTLDPADLLTGDQTTASAVRRLDERGVRATVLVRVFGMQDSFKSDIERLIGHDIEADAARPGQPAPQHDHGQASSSHGDHGHGSASAARIRSPAVLTSAGGLDDHPLFAQALVARAKALSRNPAKETVILTAHGTKEDERNDEWLALLESIANKMRANGGAVFRDIRVATWREDWPDKREPWVTRVRGWVEQAGRDGDVIVIPARTNGVGPEARLLTGLNYRLGAGFAPHPLFARWVDEQVVQVLDSRQSATTARPRNVKSAPGAHHH
jgi:hypothetical protein